MSGPIGVLLMAYGSPPQLDRASVQAYLRHILQHYRGTDPSPEEVTRLLQRYTAIGGSPLYPVTQRTAEALQHALDLAFPARCRVYWAMRHSPPFIEDVVARMAADDILSAVAIALAPFRSRLSTEGYYRTVDTATRTLDRPIRWTIAPDWHLHPLFLRLWRDRIADALHVYGNDMYLIFTNHSLPERIRAWNDPYPDQFAATARTLADMLHHTRWTLAYQSAGESATAWLGPDLAEVIRARARDGVRRFLIAPIGFLIDHLEVRYDIDVEIMTLAREIGVQVYRTQMPNDDPLLIALLVDLVRTAMAPLTYAKKED